MNSDQHDNEYDDEIEEDDEEDVTPERGVNNTENDENYGQEFEGDIFRDEYNVNERAGGGALDNDILAELGLSEKDSHDPVRRFALFVITVATDMTNQGFINLNLKQEIPFMVRRITNIPNPEYKNPSAYVLGYWVVSSNDNYNSISRKRFNKISNDLGKIDFPLQKQDVIRYARFWIAHNLLYT